MEGKKNQKVSLLWNSRYKNSVQEEVCTSARPPAALQRGSLGAAGEPSLLCQGLIDGLHHLDVSISAVL